MATSRTQRDRERARQQARADALQNRAAADRRRRRVVAIVAAVLLLTLVAGVFGARSTNDDENAADTTTSTTASSRPATGLTSLPFPPPGETLTTPTPCPAEDGSSPRVTTFSEPPPLCIDPTMFYEAIISTSKGDLKLQLNPELAPNAVNNFVVLSRYHYYDGQPFTSIIPRQSAGVDALFGDPPEASGPGYTLPEEVPDVGQIFVSGSVAMIPEPGAPSDGYGGSFLIATFELAPGIPQQVTQFGIMLDGQDTLIALEKASSQRGQPTEVITINSITTRATIPMQ